jgi:parallel beta-helix repeat protein
MAVVGAAKRDIGWQQNICLDQHARPLGGGIRVKADKFQMTDVLLKDFSCYTALEIGKDVKSTIIVGNVIGPNGNHIIRNMWSDGITIHDSSLTLIKNNTFKDNTDVQLILGGCTYCIIQNNTFIHSTYFSRSSFAELMIHSWPDTSGNFTGSIISENIIDCGSHRNCGYGIMIGSEPWYPSKAFGGSVKKNRVTNALMAINIDKLTGPMNVGDNSISRSGGFASSDCGTKKWPANNISSESLKFIPIKPKHYFSMSTVKCLLNRNDE